MALVAGSIASCAEDHRDSRDADEPVASTSAALSVGSTLQATGDTYIRSGAANQNQGGELVLRVQSSGNNRPLVFFDNPAIVAAIGSGTLTHADLELTIDSAGTNWGATGRPIGVHRLKQTSAEYSATWNCAIDSNVYNSNADCSGATAWNMSSTTPSVQPYLSPASATATITNAMTGVVRFDVTADVAAIAAGTWGGYGFLIRKVDESQSGAVDFKSRERGDGPRLVLTVEQAEPPPPTAGSGAPAETNVPVIRDGYVAQGEPNQNHGGDAFLRIKSSGRNRGLVAVDPVQVLTVLAGEPLNGAHLELTIAQAYSNWGPDRAIGAHLLRPSWTELGATWNCATDSNTSNSQPDCSGDNAWTMYGALPPDGAMAWVDPPSGTAVISSAQTGVVRLDVTTDVACYLAGYTALPGWLIKKEAEQESGRIELASRETATPPVLVIEHGIGPGVSVTQAQCAGTVQPPPSCTPTGPDDDCDNVDDDCDGVNDDDYTVTATSCGTGACTASGEKSCVNGGVVDSCAPGTPSSDTSCDGIDQDCDGTADDNYAPVTSHCGTGVCASSATTACSGGVVTGGTCVAGTPTGADSNCNGIDEDCDGTADEGYVPVVNHCGTGVCASAAVTACVGGAVTGGVCSPGSPTGDDSICDNVDDDCDGNVDEAYMPVLTQCGVGVCASSAITACAAGMVIGGVCTPGSPVGDDSVCDGFDDDCDGNTDESYAPVTSACGVGACASSATTSCVGGAVIGGVCAPGPTTGDDSDCDGVDDDCDSHTDESYVPVPTSCQVNGCQATGTLVCTSGSTVDTCLTAPQCTAEIACSDHSDNDSDTFTDCADPDCNVAAACTPQIVNNFSVGGAANIMGAGHPSAPGTSGAGSVPPLVALNYGANAVVTISSATGTVTESGAGPYAPDGMVNAPSTSWTVPSTTSIAGYTHNTLQRSLVGVFIGPTEPAAPVPAPLTFADGNFTTLHPALQQVFFIGDGKTASNVTQRFYVPAGATRLALGVTDLCNNGALGCFGDNSGAFSVSLVVHPNDSF